MHERRNGRWPKWRGMGDGPRTRDPGGAAFGRGVSDGKKDVGSGGVPLVPVMQAADLGDRHDAALGGRRDGTGNGRVCVEREGEF